MKKSLTSFAVALFCSAAQAAPIQISALPSSTGSGFQHNNFHDATLADGADGAKLGWFDLGSGGGFYDNVSGAFEINIDIFSDNAMTIAIGTAIGSGNLNPTAWHGYDGGLIGIISWDFTITDVNSPLTDISMNFYDVNYGKASALNNEYVPNSAFNNHMTLWGADGDLNPLTGVYDGSGTAPTVGVDFVATFVPVPAAVWLFGSGLLAIAGLSRRQKRS